MFASLINFTSVSLISLLLLGGVVLLAHYTNKRRGNKDIHQKGEKRDKQKNNDKKRQTDEWVQNTNKKPKNERKNEKENRKQNLGIHG